MTSKSQWCARAVSVTISNTRHNGLNSVREWNAPSVPIRRNSFQTTGNLFNMYNQLFTNLGQPASFPLQSLLYFFPSLSPYPHLSFPFLSSCLSPTVSNTYYVPGTKYSRMHWCPKWINGTPGRAYIAIIPPFSLWYKIILTWSIKWYLHIFAIYVNCLIDFVFVYIVSSTIYINECTLCTFLYIQFKGW